MLSYDSLARRWPRACLCGFVPPHSPAELQALLAAAATASAPASAVDPLKAFAEILQPQGEDVHAFGQRSRNVSVRAWSPS